MLRCWSRVLTASAGFALPAFAGTVQPWLEVGGSGACAVPADSLGSRIVAARLGGLRPGLEVDVQFAERGSASAEVRLRDGSRSVGSKKLAAASCEELRDAIVAVVALALSSESSAAQPTAPAANAAVVLAVRPKQHDDVSLAPEGEPARERAEAPRRAVFPSLLGPGRFSLGVGADDGTLTESTAVLRATAATRLGPGELRALGWYGLPSVRETVTDRLERVRTDFAALGLDYCHGVDAERWLSICAGLELAVRRSSQLEQEADQRAVERERFTLEGGALAGLSLAYRAAVVQPVLDVSARIPAFGGLAGAPLLGIRAVFSAAVQF